MNKRGFSLIELLIVIAIILIIAVIAIPNLLKTRIQQNEASTIGSLRTINEAEKIYASTYRKGFSPNLQSLGPGSINAQGSSNPTPSAAGLIDSLLAGSGNTSSKNGYNFMYSASPDSSGRYNSYTLTAAPAKPGATGNRYYYTDQTTTIRQNSSRQAGPSDPPLGQ